MDLQKIAAQANAATSQRPEGASEGKGMFATPFADMIRLPMLMASDFLSAKGGNKTPLDALTEANKPADKPDNPQSDNDDDRQVIARDNVRNDDARTENRSDDHSDDATPRNNDSHDSNDADRDSADTDSEEAPQQANSEEDSDTDDAEESTEAGNNEAIDSGPEQEAVDTNADGQGADGAVATNVAFEPALDALISAAHTAQTDGAPKDAAQNLRVAAAEATTTNTAGTGTSTNTENSTTTGDQAKQSQQAQNTLSRVGSQATNNADAAAKTAAMQPLAEQQAKALTEQLKSNTPVKVQVNVDNRAGNLISQLNQSLSANGVAAQENGGTKNLLTGANQSGSKDGGPQVAQARVDGATTTPGQVQAAAQLTQGNTATAAESGINRATLQISNTGAQANHSGGDGVNATTPGGNATNAQQIANAQRAQQMPTAQAPEQARPLAQQISVNITKAVKDGMDRISIQLRPDNLGRVEVKLEVTQAGRVNATIIADRPEALELLRNDSRNLERALQDAGLDTQSGDLSFSLRDQQENPGETQSENSMADGDDGAEDGNLEAEMATRLLNGDIGDVISDMRIDIRA